MTNKGRIHSVETFGTVDGPGIRYVVFTQGCPLQCKYCHNRDTWDPCGGKEVTTDELLAEIKSYKAFYQSSGGGITASGGEPTLQPEFITDLFSKVKEEGLSTALDTSGFTEVEAIRPLLGVTDLVLLDIKHTNAQKHKELTGVTNEKTLKLLAYLHELGKPVWLRYVLVPGLTDAEEDIEALGELAKKYNNIKRVEILPYHKLGVYKWHELGHEYELEAIKAPEQDKVEAVKQRLANYRLPVH